MRKCKRFITALWLLAMAAAPQGLCLNSNGSVMEDPVIGSFLDLQPTEADRVSASGTELIILPEGPAPDYYHQIADQTYDPRVCRGRNNVYYAVVRGCSTPSPLHIYKNTGNPANSNWTYVATLSNPNYALLDADILALYNINRLYVVYTVANTSVEIFGCRLDDPPTCRFVTIFTGNGSSNCSITSSENLLPSYPYLFVCWKQYGSALAAASYNWGNNWYLSMVAENGVAEMYPGNAIEYNMDSLLVCVYYKNTSNAAIVARSFDNFAAYSFSPRTAITNISHIGGIAGYLNTVLVAATRGLYDAANVVYAYSTSDGWNWSASYEWIENFEQKWPSVASSPYPYGYYNVLYVTTDDLTGYSTMMTKRNVWTNLGGAWTTQPTYTTTCPDLDHQFSSACLSDGSNPTYGGACNGESGGSPTYTVFCWAGSPEGDNTESKESESGTYSGSDASEALSAQYHLNSAPNPFNNATSLSFDLPEEAQVRLAVYDLTGRLVSVLVNGHLQAGYQTVEFSPASLAGGIYLYRLESGMTVATKKMIYLK